MISLCYASGDLVCRDTATETRLDESEELNALANLSTFFWLFYQLLFVVFTSSFPIISFQSSIDATTRALIVKCNRQRVQHIDVDALPSLCAHSFRWLRVNSGYFGHQVNSDSDLVCFIVLLLEYKKLN